VRREDLGVLASRKLADIVAMPADPTDDVSVTARADFVRKGARVYRGPESAAA
jgi:imidazolonepropionase-like amidohydrolase